jgi:hypothetical protein
MVGSSKRGLSIGVAVASVALAALATTFAVRAGRTRAQDSEIGPDPANATPHAPSASVAGATAQAAASAPRSTGAGLSVPAQSWDRQAKPLHVCLKHDNSDGDEICADSGAATWPAGFHPTPEHPTPMTVCFPDDKAPGQFICPGAREDLSAPLR